MLEFINAENGTNIYIDPKMVHEIRYGKMKRNGIIIPVTLITMSIGYEFFAEGHIDYVAYRLNKAREHVPFWKRLLGKKRK